MPDKNNRRFDLAPARAMRAIAYTQGHGASKHGPNTWQEIPKEKHLDACLSHIYKWLESDNKIDAETGQSHLWNALTRLAYVVDLEMQEDTIANRLDAIRTDRQPPLAS